MKQHVRRIILAALLAACSIFAVGARAEQAQSKPAQAPPAGQAQQSEQQPPQPTFRTGINFVRVDVIVTDKKGDAVADLQPGDFEVTEDNKPQKVETFKLIHLTGSTETGEQPRQIRSDYDEESEAARDDVRIFAILLDDYHVRLGNSMAVREPLARFITQQLGPADLVALMYPLTPLSDVRLSRDHEALAAAVRKFEGRKYDYRPRNDIEEQYSMYPASTVEQIRNGVTLTALRALVTHMGSLREGRKAVILVSEGFTNMLPPQLRDPIAGLPGVGNPARGNPLAGEGDPNEQRAQFFADADMQQDLREIYSAANRSNTAIYALDPRGLAVSEFDISQNIGSRIDRDYLQATMDTLRVLADNTDGRAIVNRNDLDGGLQQIVRDSSAYYLLGYNSTQAPTDGKFHEIKVRVRRPGLQVRARKGYWALTPEDFKRAAAPPRPGPPAAVEHALASIAEPVRGRFIRTWFGTSRGENGKTRVTFVWESIPPVPGTTRDEPARVALMATGADGQAYFRGNVPDIALASAASPPVAPASSSSASDPLAPRGPSRVVFDAPPGRMQVRIAVQNARSQVLDIDDRSLVVPDLTSPQVQLSTPAVLRAANARELQAITKDPDAVPTATREFRRTDRLLIRFHTYGPGSSTPDTSARLLNRAGGAMATLPVQVLAGPAAHQIDLPLSGLASGEYLIEVKAQGQGGEATELVPIKVGS